MNDVNFHEFAEATVTNVDDPEKRFRVKVKCGVISGIDEEIDEWVEPLFPCGGSGHGFFFLPNVGDSIEIAFVSGSTADSVRGEAFMFYPRMRWIAAVHPVKESVPEEFKGGHYRKRYGIKVDSGAILVFDRDANEACLRATKVRLGSLTAGEKALGGETTNSWADDLMDVIEDLRLQTELLAAIVKALPGGGAAAALETYLKTTLAASVASVKAAFTSNLSDVVTVAMTEES